MKIILDKKYLVLLAFLFSLSLFLSAQDAGMSQEPEAPLPEAPSPEVPFAETPSPEAPVNVDRLFDQAMEYERAGRFDMAVEQFRKIIEAEPDNTAALVRIAKLLSWDEQFEEALRLLDLALFKKPGLPEALFRKAQVLGWTQDYKGSIDLFLKYLKSNPGDRDGLAGLARVYFWSGQYDLAVETFEMAIAAGSDETAIRIDMGKVYLAQHDDKTAKVQLKKALELDPDNLEAARLLEGIKILYTFEIFPLGGLVNIYPDGTAGYLIDPGIVYHLKQTWDFSLINEIEIIDGETDNTINLGAVYRGINGLYIGMAAGFTPASNYSPYLSLKGSFHASVNETLGAGITLKSDFFGETDSATIQNDTLYEVIPEVVTYFGDVSHIKLSGSWFRYASGYDTGRISLSAAVDYYKGNALTAGFSYGGSVETMDSDRKVIEFGFGIHQKITDLISISASYNYIDTTYGLTHQVGFQSVLHW